MKALVESLSLGSGDVLVALLSAGIVWLLSSLFPESLHKVWFVIVRFALAYCLYWSPVWLTGGSEFDRALIRSHPKNPRVRRLGQDDHAHAHPQRRGKG
jgi:hypothetical protein